MPTNIDEYVIACRSYKRAHSFPDKTYRMLEHNGLTDRLYIFVANKEEKADYEAAMKGKKYKEIVIGELGCANVVRYICAHFPINQRIVFMDDDLARFYCFDADGKLDKDSKKLHRYLEDGFATVDKYGLGAFSFSFLSNKFYLQGKSFKEFRPASLAGSFYATRNIPKLILTKPYTSHAEDVQRAVQFIEHYGGVLVYWWAGFDTQYGAEDGGIQAAGERGSMQERLEKTKEISWRMYNEDEVLRAYSQEPKKVHKGMFYSLKLKPLGALRKAQSERESPIRWAKWKTWWSIKPTDTSDGFPAELLTVAMTRKLKKTKNIRPVSVPRLRKTLRRRDYA
jgi:hypothetical protein